MNLFVHYSLSQSLILQFLFLISSYDKELLLSYIEDFLSILLSAYLIVCLLMYPY